MSGSAALRYASDHCLGGEDVSANLDVTRAARVVRATLATAAESLGPVGGGAQK